MTMSGYEREDRDNSLRRIEWRDHHLCHVTGSDRVQLNTRIRG